MFANRVSQVGAAGARTPIQRAISILRRFGPDAHVYLPGVGMLNGLQAGNYLDSAGTTQGTVDQPVGLTLDAAGSVGVELAGNTLGVAPWNAPSSGSVAAGTWTGMSIYAATSLSALLTVGKTYRCFGTATIASGSCAVYSAIGANYGNLGAAFDFQFVASHSGLVIQANTAAMSITLLTFSVREVSGIHASQPTTASKPILRRGAVNLLTYSGDFTNAGWERTSTTVTAGVLDPYGGTSASRHTTVASGYEFQAYSSIPGATYTFAFTAKNNGGADARYAVWNAVSTLFIVPSTSYVSQVSGWSTVVVSFTAPAGCTSLRVYPIAAAADVLIYRAALFQGTYTADQIQALGGIPLTTTAPASTALGPYFWQFDGSNDSLTLGSVPFQMADDHAVIAGAKFSDTTGAYCFAEQGGALIGLRAIGGKAGAVWYDDGAVRLNDLRGTTTLTSAACVLAMRSTSTAQTVRLNGVTENTAARLPYGTSTISTATIGSNAAASYMNGSIYPAIAIKGTVTDPELLLLEKLVAQMSGVTI